MNERVERLRASLEEPLLVTADVNIAYLTGFESDNAALLVEAERLRLFTDFRYAEAARAVDGVEAIQTRRNVFADVAGRLEGRVAFEAEAVSYAAYETLAAGGAELVPRRGMVEALRAVKDESELTAIRRAAELTSRMFDELAGQRFIGRTERELAWWIEQRFHELGADGPAYPVIVATGPNGARPHAVPGDRKIEAGHTVVVDAACRADGYSSDCTRTFAAGPLDDELKRAYQVCLEAQLAGLDAVRPGVLGRDADAAARSVIERARWGEAFGHGLGHGLGLKVHERPYLNAEVDDVLAASSVVTVEPGIYLEGRGGIRIEDLVVVTDDGPEILTTFTKDLVSVD